MGEWPIRSHGAWCQKAPHVGIAALQFCMLWSSNVYFVSDVPTERGTSVGGVQLQPVVRGPQHPLLPLVVHPAQPLPLPHMAALQNCPGSSAQGSGLVVSVGRGLCSTGTICPSWGGLSTSVMGVLIRHALHSLRIRWSLPLPQLGMPQSVRGDRSGARHPP